MRILAFIAMAAIASIVAALEAAFAPSLPSTAESLELALGVSGAFAGTMGALMSSSALDRRGPTPKLHHPFKPLPWLVYAMVAIVSMMVVHFPFGSTLRLLSPLRPSIYIGIANVLLFVTILKRVQSFEK